MEIKYLLYFFLGGSVVSLVSYFASHSKGLIAAFFANLPVITFVTFLIIYLESGQENVIIYAKSLLIMLFPWLVYIFAVILLSSRIGVIPSLLAGLTLYLLSAYLIIKIKTGA
jgi:uncharacterized membrane protein (GlpM family)